MTPLTFINLANQPGADVLVAASVRERLEALTAVQARQGLEQEDVLMALGAISLLSSMRRCAVPENVVETLSWAYMELESLRRATHHDQGEGTSPEPDNRPHSRACGPFCRGHGTACSKDCPTCGGMNIRTTL